MFRRTLLTASIAVFTARVFAQQAPIPLPAPAQAAPIPGLADEAVALQIPAGPDTVKDVLQIYERLTQKRLILDAQVTGPVPLNISNKVPKDEAVKIIEVALLMNGFTLVPTEDRNIWKVFGIGKNPKSGGVPIYTDEALLPMTEQVVSFLFKLQYADATELQQTLSQAFPPNPALGGGQSITALPKAGALLVTENTAIIRQIIRIIYELDREPAKVDSRFFILQRADAKDIQEKLTDILTRKDSAAPAGGVVPPAGGGQAGQPGLPVRPAVIRTQTTPDGLPLPTGAPVADSATTIELNVGPNEENIIAGRIKITADVRTNRIHIVTRPENMKFIADLIEDFDANVPFGEPSVYPLKYVDATTVFESVVKAISDPGQDGQGGTGTGGTGTLGNRPQGAASTGNNLFGNRGGTQSTTGGGTGFGGGGGGTGIGGATLSESLNAEPKDLTPNAVTIGNTRIISDPRANSIIVVGNKDVKEKLFAVIAQLDVRAPQVVIHTCIGQLTLSETEQFGVNYIMNLGRNLDNFASGATTGTGGGTTTGGPGVNFVGNNPILNFANLLNQEQIKQIAVAGATGFNGYFTAGNAFDVLITALESTNKFRVVSRPILHTSNNKKAIISSGEEIAIPTSIQSGFTGGNNDLVTNSSIQFKTVALQLEVIPFINSDREVSMDIVQKIDEQAGTTTIDNNQIPRIATRVLQTNVTVPSEATLVLGGLIKARNDKTYNGIPLLSRIPLLGPLFRTTTYVKTREELVILIRPSVTFTPKESVRLTETEQEALRLEPDLEQTIFDPNHRERGIEVRRPLPLLRDEPVLIEKEVKPVKSSKAKTTTTTTKTAVTKTSAPKAK
jgi:general secretion pathway protein D